jgi:hypothetical protein
MQAELLTDLTSLMTACGRFLITEETRDLTDLPENDFWVAMLIVY